MNSIIISYDPFAMESQLLITKEGKTIGDTYCRSELNSLASTIVKNAKEFGIETICVRAPKVFYDELTNLVQTQAKIYSLTTIKMEQV